MNFFFGGGRNSNTTTNSNINSNFTNQFDFPFQNHHHEDIQPPVNKNSPPPASLRILQSLSNVKITADDLVDDSNRECAICLEEQNIGSQAVKLHCGHMFCKKCLKEWLQKHCTCPTCRFEVETDDPTYEKERIKRMKTRRLRFRSDELLSKRIAELKDIAYFVGVNIQGFIDKNEIVEHLIKSGKIDILEKFPTIELTVEEFNAKSVSELRTLLKSFGLSDEGAIEKKDLRNRLVESQRVVIVENLSGPYSNSSSSLNESSAIEFTRAQIDCMSVNDYQQLIRRVGLSSTGLLEKSELRNLLLHSSKIVIHDH